MMSMMKTSITAVPTAHQDIRADLKDLEADHALLVRYPISVRTSKF